MDEPGKEKPRRFSHDFIDDLRERIDIVEMIGRRVQLEARGNALVGLCPFHEEQKPTFNVVPHKLMYHCFGCGDGGDVFKFLMLTEGLSFADAVHKLAASVGVEVPNNKQKGKVMSKSNKSGRGPSGLIIYCVDVGSIPKGREGNSHVSVTDVDRRTSSA